MTLDDRDIFYSVFGLALLALTLQPAIARNRFVNAPLIFVIVGMVLALTGGPVIDPRAGGLSTKVVEHASELIVIISLAGAGLAIDTRFGWRRWQPTIRLLAIAMPLTILGVALAGILIAGLSLAGAMLLAAALSPTDPVLARSVQVGPPGEEETPVQVALTAEAGLNDGLAFPFVYLAIALTAVAAGTAGDDWFTGWLTFDLAYRVIVGAVVGTAIGMGLSALTYSRFGDATRGGWNSIVLVLAATMLSYGLTEAIDGYGFLAVFAAARAGREFAHRHGQKGYEKLAHHGADQLESILLVLLLIWFGMFVAGGGLAGWRWGELAVAVLLIAVLRPIAGWIALLGYGCHRTERWRMAFFGIRGMGSVFYVAYAQTHAEFGDIDAIWRITALTIVISIVVHGFAANFVLPVEEEPAESPHRNRE